MTGENNFRNRQGEIRVSSDDQSTVAPALISRDGAWFRAIYKEMDEGLEGVRTTVAVMTGAEPEVLVIRAGPVRTRYAFHPAHKTRGFYELEEGRIDLEIATAVLTTSVADHRVQVRIGAELTFHGVVKEQRDIRIDLLWASGVEPEQA